MDIEVPLAQFPTSISVRQFAAKTSSSQRLAALGLLAGFGIIAFAATTSSESLSRVLLIVLAAIGSLVAGLSISTALYSSRWRSWIGTAGAGVASSISLIALIALTPESKNRDVTLAFLATFGCLSIWTINALRTSPGPRLLTPDATLAVIASVAVGFILLVRPEFDYARGILLASISLLVASIVRSESPIAGWMLVAIAAVLASQISANSFPNSWLLLAGGALALLWVAYRLSSGADVVATFGIGRVSGLLCAASIAALSVMAMVVHDRSFVVYAVASLSFSVAGVLYIQRILVLDRGDRIASLTARHDSLIELARLDSLTRLPNRAALDARLEEELERAVRYRQPMSICFIDVDHFKSINDLHGHPTGDQVLLRIAELIRMTIRTPDFVARYGGEEFIVIAPGTWTHDAAILGKRIQKAVQDWDPGLTERALTVSVGIAGVPEHATGAAMLLKLADQALYTAKYAGRNRVEIAVSTDTSTPT